MPRNIDCPEDHYGQSYLDDDEKDQNYYWDKINGYWELSGDPVVVKCNCNKGKITVYTKEELHEAVMGKKASGRGNPLYIDYFKETMKVLKEKGYIESSELTRIFHVENRNRMNVMNYFEKHDEPLYDEKIKIIRIYKQRKKKVIVTVFKRQKILFDQWREEAKDTNGYHNGYHGGGIRN